MKEMLEIEKTIEKAEIGYDAKVVSIKKTTSGEFFGKTKYEDREGFEITFELADNKEQWSEYFNKPKELGVKDSKIYQFRQQYGKVPEKGMTVKAIFIDGNFRVKLL